MLIWPVFSSVARALLSNSFVIREHAQDLLERPLVHASRLNRHGTVSAPLKSRAQLFDATRRAIPSALVAAVVLAETPTWQARTVSEIDWSETASCE